MENREDGIERNLTPPPCMTLVLYPGGLVCIKGERLGWAVIEAIWRDRKEMAGREDDKGRPLAAKSPKTVIPSGAIPRGANFVLGGMAG